MQRRTRSTSSLLQFIFRKASVGRLGENLPRIAYSSSCPEHLPEEERLGAWVGQHSTCHSRGGLKEHSGVFFALTPLFLCRQEPGISSLLLGVVFLDEETSGSLELLGRAFLVDKKLAD